MAKNLRGIKDKCNKNLENKRSLLTSEERKVVQQNFKKSQTRVWCKLYSQDLGVHLSSLTSFAILVKLLHLDGAVRTTQDWSSLCVRGEVSRSCISRLIFVAHRTGRFPSIGETLDARQCLCLAKPAAGVVAAGPAHRSPQGALVQVPC